ncbi:E1-E2 ATPase-domain-containing protein, partial [Lipomyces starkeyi]
MTFDDDVKEQTIAFDDPLRIKDEEAATNTPKLRRRDSNISNGGHSRRNSIDPAAALPIAYRTMSMGIDEPDDPKRRDDLKKASSKTAKELSELDWHSLSLSELYTRLSTSAVEGLSIEQVQRRLAEYGKNTPSRPPSHLLRDLFSYFFGGFGSILLVARFNAWQDFSSSRVMASITGMLPDECHLLRDGARTTVIATEIVPGDVLFFKAGSKLPADIRFIQVSSDAKFDRAILTGESIPLPATVDSTDDNYLETRCIGLQGTFCSSGSGVGVVVSTGDRTVFGRIAKLAAQPNTGMTTLQKEVFLFCVFISILMITMIVIVIIVWAAWLRKDHPGWINVPMLIVSCVSVAVAFIPEGLPIAVTASLTITANLMRKNKILCKSLKTVETLGAVSVICTDKTGTLTKNNMWVTECAVGCLEMTPRQAIDRQVTAKGKLQSNTAVDQLQSVASLCNAGEFDVTTSNLPLEQRKINGDATDQAVLRFAETLGSVAEARAMWIKQFELPFNSKNKFMTSVFSLAKSIGQDTTLTACE